MALSAVCGGCAVVVQTCCSTVTPFKACAGGLVLSAVCGGVAVRASNGPFMLCYGLLR